MDALDSKRYDFIHLLKQRDPEREADRQEKLQKIERAISVIKIMGESK